MGNLINLGKEVKASSPNGLNYNFVRSEVGVSPLSEVLNIQGPGYLKSTFILNSSGSVASVELKIEVDGVVFIHLDNIATSLGANKAVGLVDEYRAGIGSTGYYGLPFMENVNTSLYDSIQNAKLVMPSSESMQLVTSNGALFYIPDRIRFNSSLKIAVKKPASTYLIAEYYLD